MPILARVELETASLPASAARTPRLEVHLELRGCSARRSASIALAASRSPRSPRAVPDGSRERAGNPEPVAHLAVATADATQAACIVIDHAQRLAQDRRSGPTVLKTTSVTAGVDQHHLQRGRWPWQPHRGRRSRATSMLPAAWSSRRVELRRCGGRRSIQDSPA